MEDKEYIDRLEKLKSNFEHAKLELQEEFLSIRSKFKIGDIIKDNIYCVKINNIRIYIQGSKNVILAYYGTELKKDLTPKLNKSQSGIYETTGNVIELIK